MSQSLHTTQLNATAKAPEIFKARTNVITYRHIPPIRHDLELFLKHRGISSSYTGMVLLTLSEVLTNLVKHPPQKPDIVEISVELKDGHLVIDIADNGTPFAAFDAKCNTAFTKVDSKEGFAESGFGLGCILQQHTGVFYTSMQDSHDGLNHFRVRDDVRMPSMTAEQVPLTRKRIFLVDDDPVSIRIHAQMLDSIYEVETFETARAAIEAFRSRKPDMVISDLSMPDIDGIGLRKMLSSMTGGDSTPFIFLSAHRSGQTNPYINQLGVDDYLCKPITKERILAVTSRLFNRSQQISHSLQGNFHTELTRLLKPSLPERYSNWRIVTLSAMADAGGGDFTFHQETPQHFTAVLADVMGHGEQAKFFSYAYAGYLRSIFRTMGSTPDPAFFLKRLSSSVDGDEFLESIIMTCIAIQLESNGTFSAAAAGHPAPLVASKDGVQTLDIAGPLPGLIGESEYVAKKRKLLRGDKVLVATDGFFQSFGTDLAQRFDHVKSRPADEAAGALWLEFQSRSEAGSLPRDDATLILIEFGG